MTEILGLGMTHYPPLIGLDQDMAGILRTVLEGPGPARALPRSRGLAASRCGASMATTAAPRRRPRIGPACSRTSATRGRSSTSSGPRWSSSGATTSTRTSPRTSSRPSACSPTTRSRRGTGRATPRNNVWGEGRGHDVPLAGASGGRQVPGAAAPRAGRRHVLRLHAAAPSRARARLPQHHPLPRLRPGGLPLPGGRLPGELLRPPGDRPARRSRAASPTRSPTPSSTRPRRRPSAAWRRVRRRRARCARARGARR